MRVPRHLIINKYYIILMYIVIYYLFIVTHLDILIGKYKYCIKLYYIVTLVVVGYIVYMYLLLESKDIYQINKLLLYIGRHYQ